MVDLLLIGIAGIYLLKVFYFSVGWRRATRAARYEQEPFVTIIVAARDEENNIERCLSSLSRIEYPRDKHEILVIDDQSVDGTAEIIGRWAERNNRIRPLRTEGRVFDLRGKANAVAQAMEHARGSIIVTTDADCIVPERWVREVVSFYGPDVGCVCGVTLLDHDDVFTGMQSLDWAYLLIIASAGVGWGLPLSAVGNNMSYRREAYDAVGGYRGVGFSVTEDFALLKAIGYRTRWKIRYPINREMLVWSVPCADWREVYLQKKRWGKGGVKIHFLGYMIMAVGFLMSAGLIAAPFLLTDLWLWPLLFFVKCAGDLLLIHGPLRALGMRRLIRYFLPFEIYYIVYVTVLPFVVALTGRVSWKGRKL